MKVRINRHGLLGPLLATVMVTLVLLYLYAFHDSGEPLSVAALLADSLNSMEPRHPVELQCPLYQELRRLDFLSPVLRHRLCRNAEAFKRYRDGYPLCQLQNPLPIELLDTAKNGSRVLDLLDLSDNRIPIFAYRSMHFISNEIEHNGRWKSGLASITLGFASKLVNTTFLDISSNIGPYSLLAARLGLPVVALDANIRNLLRLQLSLNASDLDATLLWNFIGSNQHLRFLQFHDNCNMESTPPDAVAVLTDTIPGMPVPSEKLAEVIQAKNVVMQIGTLSEMDAAGFVRTSAKLFSKLNVVAVKVEWSGTHMNLADKYDLSGFFRARGYSPWRIPSVEALNIVEFRSWKDFQILWLHREYRNYLGPKFVSKGLNYLLA